MRNKNLRLFCFRSQHLLNLSAEKIDDFIAKCVDTEPVKVSTITCMSTLNRNSHEKYSVACPVVATEAGHVFILDPQVFSITHQVHMYFIVVLHKMTLKMFLCHIRTHTRFVDCKYEKF